METPRPPKGLFSTGFDEIARAWHKNPGAPDAGVDLVRLLMALEGLSVAEGLLVSPKISFRVTGENVVLCRLIEMFGVGGVERLLEEDAVEFILWRPLVLHMEKPLEGVFPVLAGNQTSAPHCQPDASIELGLKGWSTRPASELKRLAKLAIDRTRLPDESAPHAAVGVVRAAFEEGRFVDDGLDPKTPAHLLGSEKIALLNTLGERIVEASVVVKDGNDFHDATTTWETLVRVAAPLRGAGALNKTVEEILRLECLPNIPRLFREGSLRFEDIVGLRSTSATTEFREWLWSQPSPTDAKAVGERYLASLKPGARLTDNAWFKAVRVTTVSLVGSAVGSGIGLAVAGVPGMIAGAGAGLALSLADAFGGDAALKSKNPRRFADEELRPRIAEAMARAPRAVPPPSAPAPSGSPPQAKTPVADARARVQRAEGAAEQRKAKAARRARKAQKAKQRRKKK